jgi:hypothetical protein
MTTSIEPMVSIEWLHSQLHQLATNQTDEAPRFLQSPAYLKIREGARITVIARSD